MLTLSSADKAVLDQVFRAAFGRDPQRYFSAPGRTEIGGNHTDHQKGRVLAAAVNLDTRAAVRVNGTCSIRLLSEGYPLCQIDLTDLTPRASEKGTTAALIRGVAAGMKDHGYPIGGFDAYVTSSVLPGSGLSSSAAFEVLVGAILNGLFGGNATAAELAALGQYAENVYFGKPCGLMDQMSSAVGGLVSIDFASSSVEPVNFDFSSCGHALCIIDTGADHANLTHAYATIPAEMKSVAAHFQAEVLSQVPEVDFYAAIPALRRECGHRAVLRAIHFYQENHRVARQVAALERNDFSGFLKLVEESGRSSWMYLQNVVAGPDQQEMALALALCHRILEGRGACRVHGGGFAGMVQAYVPKDMLDRFRREIETILGPDSCHILSIRPQGAVEMDGQM